MTDKNSNRMRPSNQKNSGETVVNVTGTETGTKNILACARAMKAMIRERTPDDPDARVAREDMRWFAQEYQRRIARLEKVNPESKAKRLEKSVLLAQYKQLVRELGERLAMETCDRAVPYYRNTTEGKRCYQAALKMIIEAYRPHEEYSWAELDTICERPEGAGSWPFAGLSWLKDRGFELENIELMDNRRFALEGHRYLVELFGAPHVGSIDSVGDLSRERAAALAFVDKVHCEVREPSLEDIQSYIARGYLLICNVNSFALNGKEGYRGHHVVVKGYRPGALILHDPGPPGEADREVPLDLFEKAWSFPTAVAKNLVAIRG